MIPGGCSPLSDGCCLANVICSLMCAGGLLGLLFCLQCQTFFSGVMYLLSGVLYLLSSVWCLLSGILLFGAVYHSKRWNTEI